MKTQLAILLSLAMSASSSLFALEVRSFVLPTTLAGYADYMEEAELNLKEHALPKIGYQYCPAVISETVSDEVAKDIPFSTEESISLPFDASCKVRVSPNAQDPSLLDIELDLDSGSSVSSLATTIPSGSSLLFTHYPSHPSDLPSLIAIQIKK